MVAGARFTLGSFLARFAFALLVAGATYNPTRYSYYAWVKSTGFAILAVGMSWSRWRTLG